MSVVAGKPARSNEDAAAGLTAMPGWVAVSGPPVTVSETPRDRKSVV